MTGISEGWEWLVEQPDRRKAWETCHRGDWMLDIIADREVDTRAFIGIKAECATLVADWLKDARCIKALQTAHRFATDMATREELDVAYIAAVNAADEAYFTADAARHAAAQAATDAAGATRCNTVVWAREVVGVQGAFDCKAPYPRADVYKMLFLKQSADIVRKWIKFEDLGI